MYRVKWEGIENTKENEQDKAAKNKEEKYFKTVLLFIPTSIPTHRSLFLSFISLLVLHKT